MAANYTGLKVFIGAISLFSMLVGWNYFDVSAGQSTGQATSSNSHVAAKPRTSRGS